MILNSPTISGSLTVTGNIIASGSITLSGSVASASFASTASFVALAQSASNAVSAQTASFANAFTVAGNLTVDTNLLFIDSTNNRVGVGTTTPSASLDIDSATTSKLRLSNSDTLLSEGQITGQLEFYQEDTSTAGTGITGIIAMKSVARPDTGTFFGNAADMGFYISGDSTGRADLNAPYEALTLRSNGNIGIGTTSPIYKLDVSGSTRITNGLIVTGSLNLSGSLTTTGTLTAQTLVVQTITSSVDFVTGSTRFGSILGNTHVFTGSVLITGSLAVGSGSFPQTFAVKISGSAYNGTNVWFQDGSPTDGISFGGNGNNSYKTLQTYGGALYINQSTQNGLVVGGSSVFSGSVTATDVFSAYSGFRNYTGGVARGGMYTYATITGTGTDYSNTLFAETGYSIYFCPNGSVTKIMTITTDGYTKMSSNGTNLSAGGYYHECYGGAANGYTLIVASPVVSPASQYVFDIRFTASTPNNTSARFLNCSDSTSTKAYIRSNGGLSNYQANNTDLSDIRTKKDIVALESYWNKFKALEIVKYKYKDQTHDDYNIGVIAQQVESVAPEFVDVDGWSKNDIESESPLKSIYTKDLYHATIKVLQEAMAKIETLQTQNDDLQSRIETLESK